jgi:hypothetical protein
MAIMLAVQGYFEAGRFVTSDAVTIPEHKYVIVVVPDERTPENSNAKAWRRFLDTLESIDEAGEESPLEFERASLHRDVNI